jgi:ATP-binding cassette, subfamily B, multidrug efflux pump
VDARPRTPPGPRLPTGRGGSGRYPRASVLAAVRDAHWILVLDGGRIVEQGTHAELVAAAGRYWELLRRQQLEEELEEEGISGETQA